MIAGRPRFLLLTVLMTWLVTSPARAQAPGGYQPAGGMGPGGGAWDGGAGRGMGPGRPSFDVSDLPTPEDIDGPPTPGTFKQLVSLTDQQTERYTRSWDSLMAETKAQRDSARDARDAMRSAFRQRDRDAAQDQAKVLSRLGKDLKKRNDAFDKSLSFLNKDQQKQYEDYKKEQKKAREEERRRRFGGGPGAEPPGSP